MFTYTKKKDVDEQFIKLFAELGRRGGKAAAKKLTKEQRIARAMRAVAAREAKRKGGKQ